MKKTSSADDSADNRTVPRYRSFPLPVSTLPPGIAHIVGNEAAERFSYYGMRAILVVYMTQYLAGANGRPAPLSATEAQAYFHLFVSATYFTPVLGALLADVLLGKYRTIIMLSCIYCLGHLALALDDTLTGLLLGQTLIALGAGGIKPCVSTHVGDQFNARNQGLLERVYGWFYLAINLGAFSSMLVTPWLLAHMGASFAFALPGVMMALATLVFWAGRWRFAHIPPSGVAILRELGLPETRSRLASLTIMFLFIAVFWALFDQTGSSWVMQAQKMDRRLMGLEILPSQIQAINPLLILILVPLFNRVLYPLAGRFFTLTAVRKIVIGMTLAALSYGLTAWTQCWIDAGSSPSILWQAFAYVMLTSGEVMVSITALDFCYTQAPLTMKSLAMAVYMSSIAIGNLFTSAVNFLIMTPEGTSRLAGANYFWLFAALMAVATLGFSWYGRRYHPSTLMQSSM